MKGARENSKSELFPAFGRKTWLTLTSWRFGMGLVLFCLMTEVVALMLGTAGKMHHATREALEAGRIQLAIAREKAKAAEVLAREPKPAAVVSGSSRLEDIDSTLKPRDLQQILEEEGTLTPDEQEKTASVATEIVSGSEVEDQVEKAAAADDAAEMDRLLKASRVAMIEGDMRRCIVRLEQASVINPEHPALLYFFGMAYEKLLNVDKAREYYTRLFAMRERAGGFFEKAAMRLKGGFETPDAMRGKMSFGPIQSRHSYNTADGETVVLTIPVLLAPGQDIRPEDVYISIQFFDIVNGRNVQLTRAESPAARWLHEDLDWGDGEELLEVTYRMPILSNEEIAAFGELKYYGYTVKLFYKGEPLDCVGSPAALLLIEQSLQHSIIPGAPDEILPGEEGAYTEDE